MERDFVIRQLKEEAKNLEKHLIQLQEDEQLTLTEAEQFLQDVEKLYRSLAVYSYILKQQEIGGDLKVHLKIMQNAVPIEQLFVPEKENLEEPIHKPIIQEKEPFIHTIENITSASEENIPLKKIEFSINDKFRIINELFFQSQQEFQAALQQLNSITTLDESLFYLDSLKPKYSWKDDNVLVKSLYTLVHKRFS